MLEHKSVRLGIGVLALAVLASIYLFQQFNYFAFFDHLFGRPSFSQHPNVVFIVNKTLRLILNDLACLLIILVIFKQRK